MDTEIKEALDAWNATIEPGDYATPAQAFEAGWKAASQDRTRIAEQMWGQERERAENAEHTLNWYRDEAQRIAERCQRAERRLADLEAER